MRAALTEPASSTGVRIWVNRVGSAISACRLHPGSGRMAVTQASHDLLFASKLCSFAQAGTYELASFSVASSGKGPNSLTTAS
jgi:hypothetical protein